MKQIRRGIFETNSSSMHSISIYRRDEDFGKIPENATIAWSDFYGLGIGGETELGKLKFCMNLVFSIIATDDYTPKVKRAELKKVKTIINEILDVAKKSKLAEEIEPREIADMYSGDSPDKVFKNFVKTELGKEIQGEDILSEENLGITVEAITKIIFSPDIVTIDHEIC